MNLLLVYIPTFLTLLWALWVMIRQHRWTDISLLCMLLVVSAINEYLVYEMVSCDLSTGAHIVQMAACSCILPLLYMLLAHRVSSRQFDRHVLAWLWGLAVCSFIPNILVYNPFEPLEIPEGGLKPFAFYVLSHGEKVFGIYCGDLVVMLQSVVLLVLLVFFVREIRSIGLHINSKVSAFLIASFALVFFAILLSTMDYVALRDVRGSWFYFGVYSLLTVTLNVFIALGFDLSLVQTKEGETVPNVEEYVQQQYLELAVRFRCLMEEENLYRDSNITAERVIERLHTNHTYFSHMMSAVVKMSFSDYLNELRLQHVRQLLSDDSVSIAAAAEQSGFTDPGYMARRFKARFGCSPSEWRKRSISTEKSTDEPDAAK